VLRAIITCIVCIIFTRTLDSWSSLRGVEAAGAVMTAAGRVAGVIHSEATPLEAIPLALGFPGFGAVDVRGVAMSVLRSYCC